MESQKFTNRLLLVLAFIALAYLIFAKQGTNICTKDEQHDHTIGVEGRAEAFVSPDTAKISFSATKKATNVQDAMNSVNERMSALTQQLQEFSIEEKDIKTTSYAVRPEHSYNDGMEKFDGYRATQRVEVTIRDLKYTSGILEIVHRAELDQVSELTFFVEDEEEIMADLRAKAIADAKQKAKELSRDLGVELDTIVGFYRHKEDDMGVKLYHAEDKVNGAKEEVAPTIPEGENKFTMHVTIVYQVD